VERPRDPQPVSQGGSSGGSAFPVLRLTLALARLNEACRDWTSRAESTAIAREAGRVHEELLRETMDSAAVLASLRRVSYRVVAMADRPPENVHTLTTPAGLLRDLVEWLEEVCEFLEHRLNGSATGSS
jgi:hypothetical protein